MQPSMHDAPLLPPHLLVRVSQLCQGLNAARCRVSKAFACSGKVASPEVHRHGAARGDSPAAAPAVLAKLVPARLSIVIPALNEEVLIGNAIRSATQAGSRRRRSLQEVIVADGGSTDGTVRAAKRCGAKVVCGPRGRGTQMNAGARRAKGDVLLFLHADSQLPEGYSQAMQGAWDAAAADRGQQQPPRWGCFESIQLGGGGRSLRGWLLRSGVRWRTRAFGAPYGDQAIFVDRNTFRHVGGFRDWPLLEDVNLTERLRRFGPPVIVPRPVTVSARRWDRLGLLRTFLLNQYILCAWKCGTPPDKLAETYSFGSGK